MTAGRVFGERAGGRVGAIGEDVFAVDVLRAGGEGAAMLAAGVALFEAVELEFWTALVDVLEVLSSAGTYWLGAYR